MLNYVCKYDQLSFTAIYFNKNLMLIVTIFINFFIIYVTKQINYLMFFKKF